MQDCMRYRIAIHDRQGEKNYYRLVIEKRIRRITPEGEMFTEVQGLDVINQEDIVRLETRPESIEGGGQITQRDLVRTHFVCVRTASSWAKFAAANALTCSRP